MFRLVFLTLTLVVGASRPIYSTASEFDCGPTPRIDSATWDYTDPANWRPSGEAPKGRIKLVENVHFDRNVESLKRGHTSETPLGDIAYTLTRFPNHHRALWAISRYMRLPGIKEKELKRARRAGTWPRTADCFFDRAIRFKSDDAAVHMLFGMHLHMEKKLDDALKQFEKASKLGEDSTEYHYNYGLLLFDLKVWEEARKHAAIAYGKGYPLSGLRKKLEKSGHWKQAKEPETSPPPPPAAPRAEEEPVPPASELSSQNSSAPD